MNITARIAYLEFRGLFFSPVAWLVLIIFAIPAGNTLAGELLRFYQDLRMNLGGSEFIGITQPLFADPYNGIYAGVQSSLYLYIPLLTMGLISRELSSGSIKLLYSSPIKVSQIVLGKFLALLAYGLLLIGILGLVVLAASMSIESMDLQFTLSGLLGLYLLIAVYAAIGLFISCLTSYQVVAAVSTLIVLAFLNYVGKVWQQYDFVRDLTYFLSIAGRSENFIRGQIASKDVAYFLIVIAMFLVFSIVKLQAGRESARAATHGVKYASAVIIALLLGYVTSRPAFWLFKDMTANESLTLTANSQAIVARLTQPLKMTTYANLLDNASYPALPRLRNRDLQPFEDYVRFKPDLEMKYVYYYDKSPGNAYLYEVNPGLSTRQLAQQMAENEDMTLGRFLAPEQIRKTIDLRPEGNRLVRQIEYQGRKTFLRMFDDPTTYPTESETTAALKRLISTPPKLAFLTGHGERRLDRVADSDYLEMTRKWGNRDALINQGFDVVQLELKGQRVPDDVTVLVIADPKQTLAADAPQINEYIGRGGNVLIAADPGDQAVLNPLLEPLAVRFTDGNVVQENADLPPDFVVATLVANAVKRTASDHGLLDQRSGVRNGYLFRLKRVSMPLAMGIRSEPASPFVFHPVMVAAAKPHEAAPVPVAAGLTRQINGKEQRVMVVGDADFMSNQELARSNIEVANAPFTLETFKWLSYGEFPIDATRPLASDNKLRVDRNGISMWKMILCGALPALIAIVGATVLIRRRRRE